MKNLLFYENHLFHEYEYMSGRVNHTENTTTKTMKIKFSFYH